MTTAKHRNWSFEKFRDVVKARARRKGLNLKRVPQAMSKVKTCYETMATVPNTVNTLAKALEK